MSDEERATDRWQYEGGRAKLGRASGRDDQA